MHKIKQFARFENFYKLICYFTITFYSDIVCSRPHLKHLKKHPPVYLSISKPQLSQSIFFYWIFLSSSSILYIEKANLELLGFSYTKDVIL